MQMQIDFPSPPRTPCVRTATADLILSRKCPAYRRYLGGGKVESDVASVGNIMIRSIEKGLLRSRMKLWGLKTLEGGQGRLDQALLNPRLSLSLSSAVSLFNG